jgi:hypothetical protein
MQKGLQVLSLMNQEDVSMGNHQLLIVCACLTTQMFQSGLKLMGGGKGRLTEFLAKIMELDLD